MSWRDMTPEQITASIQQTVKDIESHSFPKPVLVEGRPLGINPTLEQNRRLYRDLGVIVV